MKRKSHRLLLLLSFLSTLGACQKDEDVPSSEQGGAPADMMAGEVMAGEVMAGEVMAGEVMAGEATSGEATSGEMMAGEATAGTFPFGEEISSEGHTRVYRGISETQFNLSNAHLPCDEIRSIAPYLPDEAGHHAGALLVPHQYPFTVKAIQYTLEEAPDVPTCRSGLAHHFEVSVLDGDSPPLNPEQDAISFQRYEIPENLTLTGRRVVRYLLEQPIRLNEGQKLLVSVSLRASGTDHLCIASCEDASPAGGTELWSNSALPPYSWVDLLDFAVDTILLIEATGDVE